MVMLRLRVLRFETVETKRSVPILSRSAAPGTLLYGSSKARHGQDDAVVTMAINGLSLSESRSRWRLFV